MTRNHVRRIPMVLLALVITPTVLADGLSVDWFTIDGGAGYSTGGGFELDGTIGQYDAGPATGPMTGMGFELRGGFRVAPAECTCPGDMNGDGVKNGSDVQQFVGCLVADSGCSCADVDEFPGVSIDDIVAFVGDLLSSEACP